MPFVFMRPATELEITPVPNRFAVAHKLRAAAARVARQGARWLAVSGLLLASGSAAAQTPVSGAIAVDTRWTAANAPYVVSGGLVVQNGALLTIDPGVAVYMAPGAGITVQAGGIRAEGTASQPIHVLSDNTRLAKVAGPGDWQHWTFNAGTVNTRLDHVNFEHGSGLVVAGAAPIFNFLNLRNHQGAAITVDLAASPSGVGNQASGNTVNGIAVPAGAISGSVKWALRGIPYVVASGVVSVGAAPAIASISPDVVQQGQTLTVSVTGSRLTGLASASFDRAGLTAQILLGGTDTQASISITADRAATVGRSTLRLMTDAGEVRLNNAITLAQVQPALSSLAPSSIYAGQGTVEVRLTGRDFDSQTTVLVNSVAVSTQFVSATELRASIPAPATAASLSIRVRTPDTLNAGQFVTSNELLLPVVLPQLTLTPSAMSLVKGAVRTFTVGLPFAAPAGGASVNIVSSVPGTAAVPATIVVPEGQTTAAFQLTAADLGTSVVTASKVGFASAQAQITVLPPPVLTLSPLSLALGVGRTAELTVQSSVPATGAGLTVTLASSAPGIATVPASVTIPAGAKSATVPVSTVALGSATISAQATEFVSGSTAINVRPVSLNMPAGALVAPGLTRSIPIALSDPAPEGGLLINLISSNPAAATVPASITLAAGQNSANFTLTGVAAGAASVTASADGYQSGALPVTVDAVKILIGSPAVTSISIPETRSISYVLALSRPAPAGGVVVDLSVLDPTKASVTPASVSIPEGQTSGGTVQLVINGILKGTTTLTGSSAGLSTANVPVTVTEKPKLQFRGASVVVGKGMKTYVYEVYISRNTGTSTYAPNEALIVALSSSDPAKASVPATVTIPANSYYAHFSVTGVEFTNGTAVSIDAAATGYTAPVAKLATNVIAPTVSFASLELNRSTAGSRDEFVILLQVQGASYPSDQAAVADLPFDLSVVEAVPEGIINGFYSAGTGGTPITQLVVPKNGNARLGYIGTPTAVGSYKVRASAAGVASGTSALVTVKAPELRFSHSTVTVGKGLKTFAVDSYNTELYIYRAVNGAAFNGAEALTVNLTTSDPAKATVPATVTIPAGQNSVRVQVSGVELTNGTPVTIDATASGYTAPPTKVAVSVVPPQFTFASLETKRTPASARDDFYLQVSIPGARWPSFQAAVADMPVDLSIAEANPAGIVDGFYNVAAGGTPITQVVLRKDASRTYEGNGYSYVGTPTAAGSYRINASVAEMARSLSPVITVTPPELRFSYSSVTVGKGLKTYTTDSTTYNELYIYRATDGTAFNGAEAVTVNLTSSDPSRASVPATVTIPANQYFVGVQVTGVELTNGTPVTIDASTAGYTAPPTKVAVSVVAPQFTFPNLDATRTPASARDNFYLQGSTPGARWPGNQAAVVDMPIDLSITEAAPAGIIDGFYNADGAPTTQVVLRKDSSYTQLGNGYTYVGIPSVAGTYKVYANVPGLPGSSSALVTVSPPELRFNRTSVIVGTGLDTSSSEVYLYRAVNGAAFSGPAAVTVNLSCSSTAICTVPASVVIPAGQSSVYFKVRGVDLGSTTITADAVGYTAVQDLAVTTVTPQLVLSGPSNTNVGGQTNVSVYLHTPNYSNSQTAAIPLTVNLTSSAPGIATVPATLTIQAGSNWSNSGLLKGIAAGTTTVTASGTGLAPATSGVITISP